MGRYGWKIKNYKAATIVAKNMGLRDKYDYTEAMLHHSLFTRWLKKHGMKTDKKDESTRDIICIDFQFGLRSYTEEIAHVKKMRKAAEDRGDIEGLDGYFDYLDQLEERINSNKDKYIKYSKDDIRRMLYEEGANITYSKVNKHTGEITEETVKYLMLYRNPSKAKQGSCMFIREELYDKAYDWLTMGIGKMLPDTGAKIVEISAYAPLSTSAIEDTLEMNVEDVLIVEDQDSFLRTTADVVSAADYNVDCRVLDEEHFKKTGKRKYKKETVTKQRCIVERKEIDVKNTLWDGQALIDSSILPEFCNGMALLRNHFFKACAFKTNLQLFFLDYCQEHGIDYETFTLTDMFGVNHLAKNIKMITTNNAIKWIKSTDVISGGNKLRAYKYWKRRVKADGNVWGIVKTDHKSKLGNVQQMSYQMVNTLPCSKEDVHKIAQTSIDYVNALKRDNELFSEFLTANATEVNHYEMLNALYHWNPDFARTKLWKTDKSKIINSYVNKLRKGKIFVDGDNLTVCGNPYALLLHTVGEDWNSDPTLQQENDCIQVYTTRFADGEYLCGIRSPHNGMQNLAYFKNHHHPYFRRYFDFSNNIMAVNCICTDVQCRLNGEDSI